ncbi:hypothetical protein JW948_03080 [bacterium]|nr:hypothetical protein [bacterium]
MRYKTFFISCLIFIASFNIMAQKGPFLRFSLGPGIMKEFSTINESGLTIVTKNHAIGWCFEDKLTVYYSEFGAFISKDTDQKYHFINLDAYGLGIAYRTRSRINYHLSGAYGTVHFSDSWNKQGDYIEDGYAIAFGIEKNWLLLKRIELGLGPHSFILITDNYSFTNFSLNFWFNFYLFPQRKLN